MKNRNTLVVSLMIAVALAGCRTPAKPVVKDLPLVKPAGKPAALFAAAFYGGCDFEMAGWLVRDGFEVNSLGRSLAGAPLTWDEVKSYNVLVLAGVGLANSDGTVGPKDQQTIAIIRRFLEAGGGVFFVPVWGQQDRLIAPQVELLKPLGLKPLFEELVFDREPPVVATSWKLSFAYTSEVRPSPVTTNVSGLWISVAQRPGMSAQVVPFTTDAAWQTVLTASPTSYTRTVPLTLFAATPEMTNGVFQSRVPLVATRQVGKGRLVVCGINPTWLWEGAASRTLEGVTLDRGLRGKPSGGYSLVLNSLRWLAEPSTSAQSVGAASPPRSDGPGRGGDAAPTTDVRLGGAKTAPSQLENVFVTKFSSPSPDQAQPAPGPFPHVDQTWPGVIGVRTALSGGKGTVEEWVAQAKTAGLKYLVFLEDFAELTDKEFAQLKADCTRLTTAEFATIPGFRIRDEVGNYYFYASPTLLYPPKHLLSDDGKVFVSYDDGLGLKDPRSAKGQLNMTTLLYAYQYGSFKLMAGNYFFQRDASPVANWFSHFNAVGVITRQAGKVVEDATQEYLQIADAGQGPLPVAIDLLDDPAQLAQTPWRTVLRLRAGDNVIAGKLDGLNPVADYFSLWHFYPDNPTRIYVTDGPQIDYWAYTGTRDYGGDNRGDFVWQNLHWRIGGKVRAEAGLKEVAVYDGAKLFRSFLPGGAKEFEFALDLTHDQQHNLILIATDNAGHRAIGQEHWDRHHRMEETQCADRNNQLTYGYLTRAQDGTYVQLGGNQGCATPNKRVIGRWISPSGFFANDPFLGAPAFDGGAGGEPTVFTPVNLTLDKGGEIGGATVGESRRLMHNGDVNIGEGLAEYRFTDKASELNVWHSLWRTEPATDLIVDQRNHCFQIDPDSPLAVFLWRIRLALRSDQPTDHALISFISVNEARLWAVRGSDGTLLAGNNEDTALSTTRWESLPFHSGAYAAALDSPLGGCAVFPLTDNLGVSWPTPQTDRIYLAMPKETAPSKKGDSREVELLVLGIPRSTKYTRMFPPRTTQVVERFRRDFGLGEGGPSYKVALAAGKITSQRYLLRVDGDFSGIIEGDLISTLPIVVSGLNDRWSAALYDRQLKAARPIGILENQAWATVLVHGKNDLFIGHPVTCDNREIFLQVTQTGPAEWKVEVHNPTDAPVSVTLRANPFFDPFKGKALPAEKLELPAGSSKSFTL